VIAQHSSSASAWRQHPLRSGLSKKEHQMAAKKKAKKKSKKKV